jgi:hypothetical protein
MPQAFLTGMDNSFNVKQKKLFSSPNEIAYYILVKAFLGYKNRFELGDKMLGGSLLFRTGRQGRPD